MLIASIPVKMPTVFASGAGGGFITEPLPVTSQIGIQPGRASFTTGFVPLNFQPVASGGIPPWGKDMNGILFQVTAWLQWAQAGGIPLKYDAAFSASLSPAGYPKGALLQSTTTGHYWVSTVDNNTTNPDSGGANWTPFPDLLIQQQAGNFALDTGAANALMLALSPAPTSAASLIGSPIRTLSNHANTVTNPTIRINALTAWPMVNTDGSALIVGQISRAGQLVEGFYDGTSFQVTSPAKPPASATSPFVPGCVYICPTETPFTGTIECNGQLYAISTYPGIFNVIGNRYGGDGVSTFRVPDYRGIFMRGWDHGRGLDPNAGTRTNSGNGTTGDHVGTNEAASVTGLTVSGNVALSLTWPVFYWGQGFTGGVPLLGLAGPRAFVVSGSGAGNFPPYSSAPPSYLIGGDSVNPVLASPSGWLSNVTIATDSASDTAQICQGMTAGGSITAPVSGQGQETRPVNTNVMYVIAY